MQNTTRVYYADFLRVLATLAVVVIHVSSAEWYMWPVESRNWHVFNIFDSISRWAVPMFVMLSGMLFLNPEKNFDTKIFYKKNVLRIVSALIFWGFLYQIIQYGVRSLANENELEISIFAICKCFLSIPFGPPFYHLWFLYMIMGLYILTPIYRVFTRYASKTQLEYLLIVYVLGGFILPFVKEILNSMNQDCSINFEITETINYSLYFFAGFYFYRYDTKPVIRYMIYCFGIMSFLITIVGTSWISSHYGPNQFLYGYLRPTTMFETFSIFIFVKRLIKNTRVCHLRWIDHICNCSFGIYLIHPLILIVTKNIGFTSSFIDPVIAVPLRTLVCFSISFFIIWFIKRFRISKWIM